jgi:hypothetical protein
MTTGTLIKELQFLAFGTGESGLFQILQDQPEEYLGIKPYHSDSFCILIVKADDMKYVMRCLKEPVYNVKLRKQAYRTMTLKNGKKELARTKAADIAVTHYGINVYQANY